jgi:hypothetical protein
MLRTLSLRNFHVEVAAHAAVGANGAHFLLGYHGFGLVNIGNGEVGQACAQAPQDTQSDSKNDWFMPLMIVLSKPRPATLSTNWPCTSSQARTQR